MGLNLISLARPPFLRVSTWVSTSSPQQGYDFLRVSRVSQHVFHSQATISEGLNMGLNIFSLAGVSFPEGLKRVSTFFLSQATIFEGLKRVSTWVSTSFP